MSPDDHCELLALLKQSKAKVVLSGYPSKLYDSQLRDWHRVQFQTRETTSNHKGAGNGEKRKRTEVVWLNFEP